MRDFSTHKKTYLIYNMKHLNTILLSLCMVCSLMVMQSCDAGVELNNIDTTVSVEAALAVPVGSIRATIGNFVGRNNGGLYIDTLENRGVLTFQDTFTVQNEFHKLDLSQYISNKTVKMNVYDNLSESSSLYDGKITGNDNMQIPMTFPFDLKLAGINHDEDHQRLDSALIRNARFVSRISQKGGLPLKWEWIDKVTLDLGDVFSRPQGNTLTIYKKGDGYGYDQDIEINIDQFTINLMKDKDLDPRYDQDKYFGNVLDSCNMSITMYVTVPSSAGQVVIPSTAGFNYSLKVQFIDYEAVWGMFKPSSDMTQENEVSISSLWESWDLLKKVSLPFANPSIDMQITTQIAGAMILKGDYLYVKDKNDQPIYAQFVNNSHSLTHYFSSSEYLPLNSQIGDSTTMHVLFNKDKDRGQIDRLFTVHPDKLGYKFALDFNRQETPQIRITENSDIRIDAISTFPLIFNQGFALTYADTLRDVNMTNLSIDSLFRNIAIIDTMERAVLKVGLKIENTIPLQFRGEFLFLDEYGHVVFKADSVLIPAPQQELNESANWEETPSSYAEIITINQENMNLLAKVRNIAYTVFIDDESMQYAYEQGFKVKLTEHEALRITLGVGVDMKAILSLKSASKQ